MFVEYHTPFTGVEELFCRFQTRVDALKPMQMTKYFIPTLISIPFQRGRDRMVVGFTTTYAISVYVAIITDVVGSNLDQGEVYNIM